MGLRAGSPGGGACGRRREASIGGAHAEEHHPRPQPCVRDALHGVGAGAAAAGPAPWREPHGKTGKIGSGGETKC